MRFMTDPMSSTKGHISSRNNNGDKIDPSDARKRLLAAAGPIIRERYIRHQRQQHRHQQQSTSEPAKTNDYYRQVSEFIDSTAIVEQPHQFNRLERHIQHIQEQQEHRNNSRLFCESSPVNCLLKSTTQKNHHHEPLSFATNKQSLHSESAKREQNNNNNHKLLHHNSDSQTSSTNNYDYHTVFVQPTSEGRRLSTINESDFTVNSSNTSKHRNNDLAGSKIAHQSHVVSAGAKDRSDLSQTDKRLIEKIKEKFFLTRDVVIPKSFLLKHKFSSQFQQLNRAAADGSRNDHCHENQQIDVNTDDDDDDDDDDNVDYPDDELNRFERQKTLSEIGFGQISSYVKLHVLGAGTYSIVYKGVSRLTQKLIALKEIHLEREEGIPFTAIREVSLLKELKHCNIITLHDIISTTKTLTLVFEYVERDLSHYMEQHDYTINAQNVRLFLYQLLRGLEYCHSKKILHRDLKPQNILINMLGELKLADFGLARAKSIPTRTFTDEVVTLWYRPPDVLLGNTEYGTSIDMWGVGCIFFEMIAGYTLFTGVDPKKQIECIFEIIGTPNELSWPGIGECLKNRSIKIPHYDGRDLSTMAQRLDMAGVKLLTCLLRCNPESRILSHQAIKHEYFTQVLPADIHQLDNSSSIYSLVGVELVAEETWPMDSSSSGKCSLHKKV